VRHQHTGIASVFWASILDAPRPNPGLDTRYPAVVLMDVKSSFLSSYTQRTPVSTVLRCTCNKSRGSLPSRHTSINQLVTGLHCAKHISSCTKQTILFSHLSIWVASGSTCCHELWESSVGLGRPSISIGNLWLVCSKHFKPLNKVASLDEQQFKHSAWHFRPTPTFSQNLPQQDTATTEFNNHHKLIWRFLSAPLMYEIS